MLKRLVATERPHLEWVYGAPTLIRVCPNRPFDRSNNDRNLKFSIQNSLVIISSRLFGPVIRALLYAFPSHCTPVFNQPVGWAPQRHKSRLSTESFGLPLTVFPGLLTFSSVGTARKPPNPFPTIMLFLALPPHAGPKCALYALIGRVALELPRRPGAVGGDTVVKFHSSSSSPLL